MRVSCEKPCQTALRIQLFLGLSSGGGIYLSNSYGRGSKWGQADGQLTELKETIHKVVRIAGTVLTTDDDMALTFNSTHHTRALDLIDQIIDAPLSVFNREGFANISPTTVTKTGIVGNLGEVQRDQQYPFEETRFNKGGI